MNQKAHQNPKIWGSYAAEVQNVRRFIQERIEWMDSRIGYTYVPSGIRSIDNGQFFAEQSGKAERIKDNGETVTLIPDNKEYSEQTIRKDMIYKVFRVMGNIKMFFAHANLKTRQK